MAKTRGEENKLSDRLPNDWREHVAAYRGPTLAHYQRILKTLASCEWMSQDERERAAYVYVEKEMVRETGSNSEEE